MPPQTPYSCSCLLLQLLTHRPTLQQASFLAKGITSNNLLHTCLAVRSVASSLLHAVGCSIMQSSLQDKHTNFRVPAQDAWLLLLLKCYFCTRTPCRDDGTSNQTQHKSAIHTVRMSSYEVCMRVLFGNFS
jgi:hypothetical protein